MRRPRTKRHWYTRQHTSRTTNATNKTLLARARGRVLTPLVVCVSAIVTFHSCELAVSVCRSWPGGSHDRSTCCDVGERAHKGLCLHRLPFRHGTSLKRVDGAAVQPLSRPLLMNAHALARAHAARADVGVIVDGVVARWRCAAVSLARRRRRTFLHCDAQPRESRLHGHRQ